MDGENNGTPYEQMDDLGVFPLFLETPKKNDQEIESSLVSLLHPVFLRFSAFAFCRLHLCQGSTTGSQELIATAPLWTTKTDRYLSCGDTQDPDRLLPCDLCITFVWFSVCVKWIYIYIYLYTEAFFGYGHLMSHVTCGFSI